MKRKWKRTESINFPFNRASCSSESWKFFSSIIDLFNSMWVIDKAKGLRRENSDDSGIKFNPITITGMEYLINGLTKYLLFRTFGVI